jgi:hypothetical protein
VKKKSGLGGLFKTSVALLSSAVEVRRTGLERKAAAQDSLGLLKAQGCQPCAPTDPQLLLASRIAVIAKECSVRGATDTQRKSIEAKQQQLVRLYHLEEPPADDLLTIAWFACLSTSPHFPRTLTICFRGTRMDSTTDWMSNLDAEPATGSGDVINYHSGFFQTAMLYWDAVVALILECMALPADGSQPEEIVFTGHSKGGSVGYVIFLELLRRAVPGVPISRLRVITFGSPAVVHSWHLRAPVMERCREILASGQGAYALSFVHECDVVPRSLGSEYHNDLLYNSSSLHDNPKLRESKRYFPLSMPPWARYYYIHGGNQGRSLEIFEIPAEMLPRILDLPMGFVDGVTAWQEAHRMTNYMTKLQRFCWTFLYGGPLRDAAPRPLSSESSSALHSPDYQAPAPVVVPAALAAAAPVIEPAGDHAVEAATIPCGTTDDHDHCHEHHEGMTWN